MTWGKATNSITPNSAAKCQADKRIGWAAVESTGSVIWQIAKKESFQKARQSHFGLLLAGRVSCCLRSRSELPVAASADSAVRINVADKTSPLEPVAVKAARHVAQQPGIHRRDTQTQSRD